MEWPLSFFFLPVVRLFCQRRFDKEDMSRVYLPGWGETECYTAWVVASMLGLVAPPPCSALRTSQHQSVPSKYPTDSTAGVATGSPADH